MPRLNERLSLTKQKSGYWLWDHALEVNLAMRAETEQAAFIESISYLQRRLARAESNLRKLTVFVDEFNETAINLLKEL